MKAECRMNPLERLLVVSVPLLLSACAATGARGPLPARVAAADYEQHLARLASDEFEGRKPGTEGERRTVEYLIEQFRGMGLEPGNGDSWVQQVPIVEMTTASDARLEFGGRSLRYLDDMVVWTRRVVSTNSIFGSWSVNR